jgi:Fe-S cluster biogenesis protein NfuA
MKLDRGPPVAAVGLGVAAGAVAAVIAEVAAAIAAAVAAVTAATIDRNLMCAPNPTDDEATRRELLGRIERVLDDRVRPDLRADGGDIVVVGIDCDNIVQVRLTGACQGCSSSVVTLAMRVEATLKALVPEVRFIEAVP